MPDDPSHRELAAICLAMAKRASGLRVRASLLKIAQKWHDLAEIDDRDAARLRAVQREIGRELRTHYKLPKELPHRVFTLLMQLDAEQSGKTRF
jgi:hypothetical protein